MKEVLSYEDLLAWATEKMFLIPTAEIYPSKISGFFDLGPRGEITVRKFISLWRKLLVERENAIEIDGAQILPRDVFVASGHLKTFTDPIVKCTKCGAIYRADKLIEDLTNEKIPETWKEEDFDRYIREHNIRCPKCNGELSNVSKFNLMLRTYISPKEKEAYLKPESCQNIFLNFKWIYEYYRRLPLPIAQVGKAFRNEISPRKIFIRAREFRQADIEVYFDPEQELDENKWEEVKNFKLRILREDKIYELTCEEAIERGFVSRKLVAYWLAKAMKFFELLGFRKEEIRLRELDETERPFYAREAWDFEVFDGEKWVEVIGCHNRTDYDLSGHSKVSGRDLRVKIGDREFFPHIMEISMGVERPITVMLRKFLVTEEKNERKRRILKIFPLIAPTTIVIFPIVANKEEIVNKAREIYNYIKEAFEDHRFITVEYEEKGPIGKRYRKYDELGTPYAITIDYQTLEDDTVTIRFRDTTEQIRVNYKEIPEFVKKDLYSKLSDF